LLVVPLVVLTAALTSKSYERRGSGHFALVLMLDLGLVGTLVALDSLLAALLFGCATLAAVLLVATAQPEGTRRGALALGLGAALGVGLLLFVVLYVSRHVGSAHLVDGSVSERVFSIPELMHTRLVIEPLWGMHPIKVLWVALFVSLALFAGAWPLHAWLPALLSRVPPCTGMLLTGGLSSVSAYLLIRFGYTLLPDGTAWAGPSLSLLGAIGAVWGGFAACVERDLRRFAGYATLSTLGFVIVGISSRTAIGVQGAIALLIAHALTSPLWFVVTAILQDRVRTADTARFGGLSTELPLLALLTAAVSFGSMGAPGSFGFIGQLLNVLGAVPFWPGAAILAALSLVPVAAAHIRVYARLFFGELPASWQASPLLEPHGGRFPALERREILTLAPAALLSVALGLWPRPALGPIEASAFDAVIRVNPPGPLQVVDGGKIPSERGTVRQARLNHRQGGLKPAARRPLL
jgi:NADH-quinone oxidoreductase subunit M